MALIPVDNVGQIGIVKAYQIIDEVGVPSGKAGTYITIGELTIAEADE